MAESQAFFDRPREPRVGFEIPVPRYPRWSRGSPRSAIRAEQTGRIGVRFDSLQERGGFIERAAEDAVEGFPAACARGARLRPDGAKGIPIPRSSRCEAPRPSSAIAGKRRSSHGSCARTWPTRSSSSSRCMTMAMAPRRLSLKSAVEGVVTLIGGFFSLRLGERSSTRRRRSQRPAGSAEMPLPPCQTRPIFDDDRFGRLVERPPRVSSR